MTKGHKGIKIAQNKIWFAAILCAVIFTGCGDGSVKDEKPTTESENTPESLPTWEKHIIEEELSIEGVTNEYTFLYITDMHMVVLDDGEATEVIDYANTRYAAHKNAEGISAAEQFEDWVTYANETKVDGMLLGGDLIDFPSLANLTHLSDQLARLKMPYLYALGNHDWTYPWEYMTDTGKEEYLPLLAPFMQDNTAIQVWDLEEFYIVAIDNSHNQVNAKALATYEEVLKKGKPVIVLTHVPFWSESVLEKAVGVWSSSVVIGGGNYGGFFPDDSSTKFVSLTTAPDSPVVAVLAGHVHFYDKDNLVGEKPILQIVGDDGYSGNAILLRIKGTN